MPKSKVRERTCQWCLKQYTLGQESSQHRYCSLKCRQQWHYNRWKYNGTKRCKKEVRNGWLKRTYGITLEEFNQMWADQEYKCKICGIENNTDKNFHVDHCHKTGKVRGILCQFCNQAIGLIKENIQALENIIQYLKDNDDRE